MDSLSLDNTTWYNPKNGDTFKVRSNYFENNNMMLQTTDGRLINMNQMNDYVQWTGQGTPPKPEVKESNHELPSEVKDLIGSSDHADDILPEDYNLIYNGVPMDMYTSTDQPITISTPFVQVQPTEDQRMVARVLSKASSPKVDYKINWTKFPSRQMEMLIDFMGVDMNDICEFYIDKLDMITIREDLKKQIRDYIISHQVAEETTVQPEDKPKERTPNIQVPKKYTKKK